MEVVEAISKIVIYVNPDQTKVTAHPVTFGMLNEQGEPMCRIMGYVLFEKPTLLEAVYCAVIDFIETFNDTNRE